MGRADYLELGSWNVQCYQCGRKRKASMMKKHWQGFWVCPEHWEARHPQDFVRNVTDNMTPPWSQPQPAPQFLERRGAFDTLELTEQVTVSFGTLVPSGLVATYMPQAGGLNAEGLNTLELNGPAAELIWTGDLASEGFTLTEEAQAYNNSVSEVFSFTDTLAKDFGAGPSAAFTFSDSRSLTAGVGVVASVTLGDVTTMTQGRLATDSLTWGEAASAAVATQEVDTFTWSDSRSLVAGITVTDTTALTDSVSIFVTSPSQLNGAPLNGASLNAS